MRRCPSPQHPQTPITLPLANLKPLTNPLANNLHSAYFLFPITATPADPKPVLVLASLTGAGAKVQPLDVTNATALLHLYALGKLVVITQVSRHHRLCRPTSHPTG